ncbi:Casein kinase I RAG8 [Madurella mycetomatis]|uniref:Casein kinase I RAG8 n=1 Tax=Madurella mycetomatis TaxID=100816 RepID=A0A175VP84_9PEZI|nr:Casein kinase I RAG8 [Madurella mycetomatis]
MTSQKEHNALLTQSYEAGSVLSLRRDEAARSDDAESPRQEVKVKIKNLQQPWTLSCGMVVDVLRCEETTTKAVSGTQTAFLKLYDWRFAAQYRDDQGVESWTEESAAAYTDYVLSSKVDEFLRRLSDKQFRDDTEEDWEAGQNEAALANDMHDMHCAETTVYSRLLGIQGKTVPRVIVFVELDIAPGNVDLNDRQRRHFQIKGILLQYIPGFSLRDLGTKAPPGSWQEIVDQAVEIARSLGDHDVLNKDVRPDNFIVSHRASNGNSPEGFKVFMIDFGQSRVRRDDESDFDWGRAKWRQDEEGAVGLVMQHRLRNLGAISYTPSARYLEFAEGEDEE